MLVPRLLLKKHMGPFSFVGRPLDTLGVESLLQKLTGIGHIVRHTMPAHAWAMRVSGSDIDCGKGPFSWFAVQQLLFAVLCRLFSTWSGVLHRRTLSLKAETPSR